MPTATYVRGRATGPRVFIAVPTYSGQVGVPFLASLVEALPLLEAAGFAVDFCVEAGNCHVDDARNSMARMFLESDCSDMVFIDEDVGFEPDAIVKILKATGDVVAGVYPKKQQDEEFPVHCLPGERWSNAHGLVEVEGAPTGFMRISRRCLEALRDASVSFEGSGGMYHVIFERVIADGRRWSGDYAFCRKWRALGGKVHVMPDLRFTHTGTKTWGGSLADFWRKQCGLPSPRLVEAIKRLRAGEATHEVFTQMFDAWGNPCAALPDHLMAAYRMAKRARGPVLETGSGLTTMVMACAGAEVHSLEHDFGWLGKVRRVLDENGLTAHVHYAPMKDYGDFAWYTVPANLPTRFAMLECDGPNRDYGRAGLFRLLADRIGGADWLVDDVNDGGQLAILNHYARGRQVHVLGTEGMKQFAVALAPAATLSEAS